MSLRRAVWFIGSRFFGPRRQRRKIERTASVRLRRKICSGL